MKRITAICMILMVGSAALFAGGGGGAFEGRFLPSDEWSNRTLDAEVGGGFGYGVDRDGSRFGGFGLVIEDERDEDLYGAFGGLISGQEVKLGPVIGSVNLWTGVGYVSPELFSGRTFGYLAELNAEIGLALIPWMQVALYGGVQGMGSFHSPAWFSDFSYSPVVGARVVWGRF